MFSNTSGSSISFAIVTPSLVIVGEPNFLSRTTLRPFGPSVTFTASARMLAPRSSARRAFSSKTSCFAAMIKFYNSLDAGRHFVDDGEDIFFGNDEIFGAVNLDFAARILAIENAIADLNAHAEFRAVFQHAAVAGRPHDALLGLFLSGIGQENTARRLVVLFDVLDNHVIVQRLEIHGLPTSKSCLYKGISTLSARALAVPS